MQRGTPAIACIGIIGRNDNPLHISLFPPNSRNLLEYQLLLHTSLDIFTALLPHKSSGTSDFGLLQALDDRLSMHGWLTNTGVKIVIIVDMQGRQPVNTPSQIGQGGAGDGLSIDDGGNSSAGAETYAPPSQSLRDREAYMVGLRESDLRPAFKAAQKAYVALLKNPFYEPDEHDPVLAMQNAAAGGMVGMKGGLEIRSKKFIGEVERIGRTWYPGIGTF